MKNRLRRFASVLLALSMIVSIVSGLGITTQAQTSVKIVSFVRGEVNDLRSSELLEAKVEGYDGNISDLTFEWTNNIGTYLYIYNSSNMYNIKDTAGEIELYGAKTEIKFEDWEFVYKEIPGQTYSAKGYAWAAVYGAQLGTNSLKGSISVTVTDKNGNVIGTATYEGPFRAASLKDDLVSAKYGVFAGETLDIKDMLGRSSIVHIDCTACTVNQANVTEGNSFIELKKEDGKYTVTGKAAGEAKISLSLKKNNCKFHQNSSTETITNTIYVFKKPNTSTTTTTLVLTNLDDKCEYFIGSTQGVRSADGKQIEFTGLNPDTTYEVTVRGNYGDGYAYAYVADTTKPAFKAIVNCYTDGEFSDFLYDFGVSDNLFLKNTEKNEFIALERINDAVYTADVDNGVYHIYYNDNSSSSRVGNYQITIDNDNNTAGIYTYSLNYNLGGGQMINTPGRSIHYEGTAVYATSEIPTKEDAVFLYWQDAKGTPYKPGQLVAAHVSEPIVLTAVWEESVDIKVNITIDHNSEDGGHDNAAERDNVSFRLVEVKGDTFVPVSEDVSLKDDSCTGYKYNFNEADIISTYTSDAVNFKGAQSSAYTISCTKSGYELESIVERKDGDTRIFDVTLKYDPKNFDLKFDVVMKNDVPKEFYPAGVNVKVLFWGKIGNETTVGWRQLTQQKGLLYVKIDEETGVGSSSYPVWKTWADAEGEAYDYTIEVVSYVLEDGSVVTNDANAFNSVVSIENGGRIPYYPTTATEKGSYFDGTGQNGVPTAEISITSYNLTFDANGGTIKGNSTYALEKQLIIPDLLDYVPVREDGYTFDGWYMDKECKTPAKSESRLDGDTTLYAKWNAPLTIKGTINVEAFYEQDGKQVEVLEVDRAEKIVITLQVKTNEQYNDLMSVTKELNYDDKDIATVNYEFSKVPNTAGVEYRIRTVVINYNTLYDNNGDETFKADEYTAVFSGNSAKVDALLNFKADEYDQSYVIDATAIGEGYRPENGLTQVLFKTKGSTPPDTVISQHMVEPFGEKFNFNANGLAQGSIKLWKGISNGAISSYQLLVKSIDGENYVNESPYEIRYGEPANWGTLQKRAGVLEAKLLPKEYIVKFDFAAGDDAIGNMESYLALDGSGYFTTHKWSYDTAIAARPTREGYIFLGWKAEEDGIFDGQYVSGSVAEDITLTAQWAEFKWVTGTDTGYFVNAENQKEAVVRFLFDVETTDELKDQIEDTGIKFVKSDQIAEQAGKILQGETAATTFYGDITKITESSKDATYFALAYVKFKNRETVWSAPIACGPDFTDLIIYK